MAGCSMALLVKYIGSRANQNGNNGICHPQNEIAICHGSGDMGTSGSSAGPLDPHPVATISLK